MSIDSGDEGLDASPENHQPSNNDPWVCFTCHLVFEGLHLIDEHSWNHGTIHHVFGCATCGAGFYYSHQLFQHGRSALHGTLICRIRECGLAFGDAEELQAHEATPHDMARKHITQRDLEMFRKRVTKRGPEVVHERVSKSNPYRCAEPSCFFSTASIIELLVHGQEKHHRPFGCTCGQRFDFDRELDNHVEDPELPVVQDDSLPELPTKACLYCPKLFSHHSEWSSHLREKHHHTEFPCLEPRCYRVGYWGFTSERRLIEHHFGIHLGRGGLILNKATKFKGSKGEENSGSTVNPSMLAFGNDEGRKTLELQQKCSPSP